MTTTKQCSIRMITRDGEGHWGLSCALHGRWSFHPERWLLWVSEGPAVNNWFALQTPHPTDCPELLSQKEIRVENTTVPPHSEVDNCNCCKHGATFGAKPWLISTPTVTDKPGPLATLSRPKQNLQLHHNINTHWLKSCGGVRPGIIWRVLAALALTLQTECEVKCVWAGLIRPRRGISEEEPDVWIVVFQPGCSLGFLQDT